jgi:hypothetical protein
MRKSLLAMAAITVVVAASLISHEVEAMVPAASAGIQASNKVVNSIQAVGCAQRRVCSHGVCTMRRVCT